MYETELMREILKSPMAQKMIQEIAPRYGEAYVFLWLMQVIGQEWDEMEAWITEYRDQVVHQTATWTLPYWEEQYGLVPDPEWDDNRRRKNILNKVRSQNILTPKRLEDIVEVACGYSARVRENTGKNRFAVYLDSTPGRFDEKLVSDAIDAVIPARLLYNILYEQLISGSVYVGGAIANNAREITLTSQSIEVAWKYSRLDDIPYYLHESVAVVLDGSIHVLGGKFGPQKHFKWDGSEWTEISTLPYEFNNGNAVVLDREIHILGGQQENGNSRKHFKWDGSEWTEVGILPYDLEGGGAVVYDGKIHIFGSDALPLELRLDRTKHYRWTGSRWRYVGDLPFGFCGGGTTVHDGEIHILGSNSTDESQKHWKYNGKEWAEVSMIPYACAYGSAVSDNDGLHLIGGSGNSSEKHYVWDGSSWIVKENLPMSFAKGGNAVLRKGIIYLVGGGRGNGNSNVENRQFYSIQRMIT